MKQVLAGVAVSGVNEETNSWACCRSLQASISSLGVFGGFLSICRTINRIVIAIRLKLQLSMVEPRVNETLRQRMWNPLNTPHPLPVAIHKPHHLTKVSSNRQQVEWCSWLSRPPHTLKVSGSNPDSIICLSFCTIPELSFCFGQ